jgi:pyruvate dehydrogenase E1 component
VPYVTALLGSAPGVYVAASDFVRALPDSIAKWLPRPLQSLGTDGFGRSESRAELRNFFEVDARYVVLAALYGLALEKQLPMETVRKAQRELGLDPEKPNPLTA